MFMSKEARQRFDLLKILLKKELTLRYKRTYLGFLWSLVNPLLTTLVFFIAFRIFMRFEIENFTLFLLSALFPWTWFSTAVLMSSHTLISNVSLIKKVIFPKHFLLLSMVGTQLVTFLFSLPVLIGLSYYYGKGPSLHWLIGVPVLVVIQFFVVYGLSLVISMLNAFFRDLEYLISVLVNLLFWMTPIIYPLDRVPEQFRMVLSMNPMMYLTQAWRELFFNNTLNWHYMAIATVVAVVVFMIGRAMFKILERKLDEVL